MPLTAAFAQNACDAGKVKCVSKRLGCVMKVKAKALKAGEAEDQAKLQKCFDKFDGGAAPSKGCFAKLEGKQDPAKPKTLCTTTGDVASIALSADTFGTALVQEISVVDVAVSGTTRDYFSAAVVGSVELSSDGCAAELLDTSDGSGLFEFEVAGNSTLFVHAGKSGFHTTRSDAIVVGEAAVVTDVEVVADADVARQFATVGEVVSVGTGLVFVDLLDDGGSPLVGVPVPDITLLDGIGSPVGDGPFFFGAAGDMVTNGTLGASAEFGGRARVGFLNCPPGTYDLTVFTVEHTYETAVQCVADGVTLGATRN
jgi:hypothetical protein